MVSGRPAASASAPTLPSVNSCHPLRRNASLCSGDRRSAEGRWQATLKERLGTPGKPPGPDVLPSLYDQNKLPPRPASGMSRSLPPSTVGPSASIVAWFAQFQCLTCGKVPMALDARFCSSCGQALPLPTLPSTDGKQRAAANLAEVAAAAAGVQVDPEPVAKAQVKGVEASAGAKSGARSARPPRAHEAHKFIKLASLDEKQPLSWNQKERRVAEWMGNIKPRQH